MNSLLKKANWMKILVLLLALSVTFKTNAMKRMTHEITVGNFKADKIISVEIKKSTEMLQDIATVELPAMVFGKPFDVERKIKKGDFITIKLGYDKENKTEFKGYINSISITDKIVLKCEDALFLFRNKVENIQYKKVKVSKIIEDISKKFNCSAFFSKVFRIFYLTNSR